MRVQDSQAYREMDVTRERVSRILELREILLFCSLGNRPMLVILKRKNACGLQTQTENFIPRVSKQRKHVLGTQIDHDGFFPACQDLGKMFDNTFPACALGFKWRLAHAH